MHMLFEEHAPHIEERLPQAVTPAKREAQSEVAGLLNVGGK